MVDCQRTHLGRIDNLLPCWHWRKWYQGSLIQSFSARRVPHPILLWFHWIYMKTVKLRRPIWKCRCKIDRANGFDKRLLRQGSDHRALELKTVGKHVRVSSETIRSLQESFRYADQLVGRKLSFFHSRGGKRLNKHWVSLQHVGIEDCAGNTSLTFRSPMRSGHRWGTTPAPAECDHRLRRCKTRSPNQTNICLHSDSIPPPDLKM
mmetsp:Transcript_467/g.1036  ORF Transcript_467/g.1036 Transcript_467/m.1036 type:complete len:206 (+) Transcript_467:269-886(+)